MKESDTEAKVTTNANNENESQSQNKGVKKTKLNDGMYVFCANGCTLSHLA